VTAVGKTKLADLESPDQYNGEKGGELASAKGGALRVDKEEALKLGERDHRKELKNNVRGLKRIMCLAKGIKKTRCSFSPKHAAKKGWGWDESKAERSDIKKGFFGVVDKLSGRRTD